MTEPLTPPELGPSRWPADDLISDRFPRSSRYAPGWLRSAVSGGANPLWLTEWVTSEIHLRPGMRVLDLGCGRAASSIFLHREFGVHVWAVDLWFSPTENHQRIRDAGIDHGITPLRADARHLPFAEGFFDAIVSIDSYVYYGTDDLYLADLARFVRPGGTIAIVGAGLTQELTHGVPDHLRNWWEPSLWCLHSADWWHRHWERTGIVTVAIADTMPDGWRHWVEWQLAVNPENTTEIDALGADHGRTLGYVRVIAHRSTVELDPPITTITTDYQPHSLLRNHPTHGA